MRHLVRSWDAIYVTLAEVLGATSLTTDERLGRVGGLRCQLEVA
jgi:predicted nucleic acid-binding protein